MFVHILDVKDVLLSHFLKQHLREPLCAGSCPVAEWKVPLVAATVPPAPTEGERGNKWSKITLLSPLGAQLVLLTSPDTFCTIDLGIL